MPTVNTNSIMVSVKLVIGYDPSYTEFDEPIKEAINTAFSTLTQIGCGPFEGFKIEGATEEWDDYIENNDKLLSMVKTYIQTKARLIFDPPQNASLLGLLKEQLSELESRISYYVDAEDTFNEPR